jgi:hypothetical protein
MSLCIKSSQFHIKIIQALNLIVSKAFLKMTCSLWNKSTILHMRNRKHKSTNTKKKRNRENTKGRRRKCENTKERKHEGTKTKTRRQDDKNAKKLEFAEFSWICRRVFAFCCRSFAFSWFCIFILSCFHLRAFVISCFRLFAFHISLFIGDGRNRTPQYFLPLNNVLLITVKMRIFIAALSS